jgi:hypothetical protein
MSNVVSLQQATDLRALLNKIDAFKILRLAITEMHESGLDDRVVAEILDNALDAFEAPCRVPVPRKVSQSLAIK